MGPITATVGIATVTSLVLDAISGTAVVKFWKWWDNKPIRVKKYKVKRR